jgi:3-deoxy-7-phosphoheptulonate synthase
MADPRPSPSNRRRPSVVSPLIVAGVAIGGDAPVRVIAGPCSVEGRQQFRETAEAVTRAGASLLRGGAFKPRTSPYSFQGLGEEGLRIMRESADELGTGIVTEAVAVEDVPLVAQWADMIQIGARNMDNRPLLQACAETGKPILLKRGMAATVDEVLEAAELILELGNDQIAICERGSRTFEPAVRNSLDIQAIPDLKSRTSLPIIADPSHGTGRADLVAPVAMACIAAGADGLLVEVHPDPATALSDGPQSLPTVAFTSFMDAVGRIASAVGRGTA